MAIENLRKIGDTLYERRDNGVLYPISKMASEAARREPDAGSLTGFPEIDRMLVSAGNVNQALNPVEAIGQSMGASRRMLAPETKGWDRVAALGDMLSGVGGVVAPLTAVGRLGKPAATALMESLLGGSPTMTAVGDTARDVGRKIVERANQRGPVPVMGSNFGNVLGEGGVNGGKVDFVKDNPGGDWLAKKQSYAFEYPRMKGISGAITGWMGGKSDLFLPTDVLKFIEPLNNEKRIAGDPRFDDLMSSVQKEGFDPDQKGNKIVIAVNHQGVPFILEGNTRVAVAHAMGVPNVKAEVRYWNGAEEIDGPMSPNRVSAMVGSPTGEAVADMPRKYVLGDTLPSPRNEAEAIAKDILEMRATGNVDAVTESMMNAADPQYMYNYTPLPMDQASRMARASDIGFPKDDWYHGTNQDIHGFQGNTYTADNPTVASTYARGITDAQTYPLRLRSKLSTTPVDAGGRLWSQIPIEAIDDPAVASWLDPSVLQKTRTIEPAAVKEGRSGVRFKDVLDIGPGFDSEQFKRAGYPPEVAESMRQDYLRKLDKPATIDVRLAPNQIRSRFARFDPMFAHLRNLSAGVAAGAVGLEAAQYNPDEVDSIAESVRKPGFAKGGHVQYDPAAIDSIINQLREVNHG